MVTWEQVYNFLGIKDFIYFISSPTIQEMLFPIKLIFILFTLFFLGAVIYFMIVSTWMKHHFLEDASEFFSWQAYGLKQIADRWKKIKKRLDSGVESEYKLAIIEGDDFLSEVLDERGFEGKSFEDLISSAGVGLLANTDEIFQAHKVRNSIVYEPDFSINQEEAKRILSIFETAVKSVGL
jgi:hypothetical protein